MGSGLVGRGGLGGGSGLVAVVDWEVGWWPWWVGVWAGGRGGLGSGQVGRGGLGQVAVVEE